VRIRISENPLSKIVQIAIDRDDPQQAARRLVELRRRIAI